MRSSAQEEIAKIYLKVSDKNKKLAQKAFDRGLIIYPAGNTGNVNGVQGNAFLVAPPLVTTKEQVAEILGILGEIIAEVDRELLG